MVVQQILTNVLGLCVVLGAGDRAVSEIFKVPPHMAFPSWCGVTMTQINKIVTGGGTCYEGRAGV